MHMSVSSSYQWLPILLNLSIQVQDPSVIFCTTFRQVTIKCHPFKLMKIMRLRAAKS